MVRLQTLTVAERIRSKFETLTRAERQIANTMMENYPVSGLGSITAIADSSNASTATVVRLAKKLDFGGFPDIQVALRREVEATISSPITKHNQWADSAPDSHMLNRFAESVMENMRQTLHQIDPEEFNAVAVLLSDRKRHVYVVGGRITRALADYFYTHMQMVRDGVTLLTSSSNTWSHNLLNMQSGDVLVMFDIRRYERDVLRLAELARSRELELVLFTDQWGSPAAKFASHSFHTRTEVPSAWDSSIMPLFIIESLTAAIQNLSWEESEDRMKALEVLLDETGMFRKFI
ncbi:MAG: MurR/RpiR family transcriptional regulator [Rhodospirillales bacterium]|jgi:DNA-binding MurR/RpiR family transcriptional regulator|nr:MurR/RpiR family transcriptional regulator [Rhodospirillales bacterium]MBT4040065.1 MurR/RpiR family transcriptional regulator [Rhodospirillales bacterium]MBT4625840.1 MurR/RpiR family transcriptional regulator [Rhodospirillales bacterium]MBT5351652.1 MurR/RpiR family transcriptional regulator [Rhodospirillales bacterium]MBT5521329.1 MurR/RpiR family transcriptional regulator [Rhodospirillales bacterium]